MMLGGNTSERKGMVKQTETDTKNPISNLASRSGCCGVIGSVLVVVIDFFRQFGNAIASLTYQYESKRRFLGLPLLAINIGFDDSDGIPRLARGVIAIGNKATGFVALGIFRARGLFAIAPIAVGLGAVGIAGIGLISVSVIGLGIVSVSVFAVGYLAVGILALGYKCVGIVAIGQEVVGIIGIGEIINVLFSP
jgi:hypothetical protein